MSNEERRLAWRAYMMAVLSASDFRDYSVDGMAVVSDFLLKAEQQRFDAPHHSGDANKMVEPRPWVGLTLDQVVDLLLESRCSAYAIRADLEDLLRRAENMLRANNGGTR